MIIIIIIITIVIIVIIIVIIIIILRPTKRRKHAPVLDPESRACIFHGDCVKWNCVVSFDMAQQFYGSGIIASDVEHNILRNKVAAFARQRDGCAQMATRKILLYKSVTLLAATKGHEAVHLRAAHAFNDVSLYRAVYSAVCRCIVHIL